MSWWLKARTAHGLAAACALTVVLGILLGDAELPIPVLTGQAGVFLAGHLLTVLPAVVLMYGQERTDHRIESTAARPVNRWNASMGAVAALAVVAATALIYLVSGSSMAIVSGRNIAAYIGIAMILAAFIGPRVSAVLTTLLPIGLANTGWAPSGAPKIWAWLLHDANSGIALASAAFALVAGFSALWRRRSPLQWRVLN
ncbi:hypothetical protein OG389_29685 [Streptomyces sp. NBC_00435]|uniref:hypothetical protein n=1 Tax=Streptomyces sp. NBC_00435 TaxID=2903649 RepID=UPI002E1FC65C